ncbi:hypothetical protein D9619_003509 [Psilocybe cf. subviscida]|uniref:Uncharacterized protein n=1 Tax=Psilocybe cf. subviscida TaxID=2480587 RepID=A0A8H5AWN4_9AGAR|nr:hypothetical protein D9619_003509 [Psilocybe cf. subviscida]
MGWVWFSSPALSSACSNSPAPCRHRKQSRARTCTPTTEVAAPSGSPTPSGAAARSSTAVVARNRAISNLHPAFVANNAKRKRAPQPPNRTASRVSRLIHTVCSCRKERARRHRSFFFPALADVAHVANHERVPQPLKSQRTPPPLRTSHHPLLP